MTPRRSPYHYYLPPRLLANRPASPRHNAKLLIYDTAANRVTIDKFFNLARYLPPRAFMVFNDTKVLPARVKLTKDSGGQVTVLLLVNELRPKQTVIRGLVDRRVRPGQKLYFNRRDFLTAVKQQANIFWFKPSLTMAKTVKLLSRYGTTPIPPYLKKTKISETKLRRQYQTMFARHPASTAAPTASLHFTPAVFRQLAKRQIPQLFLTLNVGLGTFAPLQPANFRSRRLHKEYFFISQATARQINKLKDAGRPLLAVGTTVTRALETAADRQRRLTAGARPTDLFIFPPYRFKIIDGLITNFHLPQSSLMMLVDAWLKYRGAQRSVRDLYQLAISKKFRFYSFGDAMLII